MGEHTKQLHCIKNGTTEDIKLYTSLSDVGGSPALHLLDGNTEVFAKLGATSESDASSLRVKQNNTDYAVMKSAFPSPGRALNDYTWDDISKIAISGRGNEFFNVGDRKTITLNGQIGEYAKAVNSAVEVTILDINHPMNGVEENNIIFGLFSTYTIGTDVLGVNLITLDWVSTGSGLKYSNMCHYLSNETNDRVNTPNAFGANYGGWKGCELRYDILGATSRPPTYYGAYKQFPVTGYDATQDTLDNPIEGTYLAAFPSDLRRNMRLWTRWVDAVGKGSNQESGIQPTVDAVTLLNEPEVFGEIFYANQYEINHNTRMAFFAKNKNYTIASYKILRADGLRTVQTSIGNNMWLCSPTATANYGYDKTGFCKATSWSSSSGRNINGGFDDAKNLFLLLPAFKV